MASNVTNTVNISIEDIVGSTEEIPVMILREIGKCFDCLTTCLLAVTSHVDRFAEEELPVQNKVGDVKYSKNVTRVAT